MCRKSIASWLSGVWKLAAAVVVGQQPDNYLAAWQSFNNSTIDRRHTSKRLSPDQLSKALFLVRRSRDVRGDVDIRRGGRRVIGNKRFTFITAVVSRVYRGARHGTRTGVSTGSDFVSRETSSDDSGPSTPQTERQWAGKAAQAHGGRDVTGLRAPQT